MLNKLDSCWKYNMLCEQVMRQKIPYFLNCSGQKKKSLWTQQWPHFNIRITSLWQCAALKQVTWDNMDDNATGKCHQQTDKNIRIR